MAGLFSRKKTNQPASDSPSDNGSATVPLYSTTFSPDYPGFSRGYSNNNPGNIVKSAIGWQGKVVPSSDEKFEQFVSLGHGVRAAVRNCESYIRKGINTAGDIVRMWETGSTSTGNPNYAAHVINNYLSGIDGTITIGSAQFQSLMVGIFDFENGGHPPGLSEQMLREIVWNYMATT